MLVLGRKVGQSLTIDDDIILTVTEKNSDYVVLHIQSEDEFIVDYNNVRSIIDDRSGWFVRLINDEAITINILTTVTIIRIANAYVRLGFNAPRHISIQREEMIKQLGDSNNG